MQENEKLFEIYLLHSLMLFTTLSSSNSRYIAPAIRLKLDKKPLYKIIS